jgi:hypothetical protein
MATMSVADMDELNQEVQSEISAARIEISGMGESDVRAFLEYCDSWADANQAGFNSGIPAPAATALSTALKSQGLSRTIEKRRVKGY